MRDSIDRTRTCTPAERALLDMIATWPGVPAIVTVDIGGDWSVRTRCSDGKARKVSGA